MNKRLSRYLFYCMMFAVTALFGALIFGNHSIAAGKNSVKMKSSPVYVAEYNKLVVTKANKNYKLTFKVSGKYKDKIIIKHKEDYLVFWGETKRLGTKQVVEKKKKINLIFFPAYGTGGKTFKVKVMFYNGKKKVATKSIKIKVTAPPGVPGMTMQELEDAVYTVGDENAKPLDATVTEFQNEEARKYGTVSYQWYESEDWDNLRENGKKIKGADKATFTPDVSKEGEHFYYCKVTYNSKNKKKYETVSQTTNLVRIRVKNAEYVTVTFDADTEAVFIKDPFDPDRVLDEDNNWYVKKTVKVGDEVGKLPTKDCLSIDLPGAEFYGWSTEPCPLKSNVTEKTIIKKEITFYPVILEVEPEPKIEIDDSTLTDRRYRVNSAEKGFVLAVELASPEENITYKWYKSPDGTEANQELISTEDCYFPPIDKVGVTYYTVVLTNTVSGEVVKMPWCCITVVNDEDY